MISNERACLAVTLAFEGGYSDNPADPGGATMRGVTQRVYDAFRVDEAEPTRSVTFITDAELRAIYHSGYWAPIGGDNLPAGIDLATFDGAVNSGPRQALTWLRAARDGSPSNVDTIERLCAARLSFMHAIRRGELWKVFGKGWSARVASVEAKAIKMATDGEPGQADTIQKKAAEAAAKAKKTTTTGVGGATAGAAASVPATHAGLPLWAFVAIAAVALMGVAILYLKARHQTQRVAALTKAV